MDVERRAKRAAYMRAWRAKHPGYSSRYTVAWAKAHPDLDATHKRRHYLANRQEIIRRSRRHKILRKYGLTIGQYDQLLAAQDGRCAICQQTPARRLDVDHCHATGRVRGLLCNSCNKALGLLRDDPGLLRGALAYLGGV